MATSEHFNDEDFIKSYSRKNARISRSNKYVKGKEGSIKGFGYIFFLIIVFLIAYFLFSKFLFPSQI